MSNKSKFNGSIGRPFNGMIFGTLEDGASVIIANNITDAKALVGSTVEYEKVDDYNQIKSIQL